jgi:hypothetical protein
MNMKKSLKKLNLGNLGTEVWASLRNFRDASYCEELIRSRHNLGAKEHTDNIRKQSSQAGQCLRQAEEYFGAARVVGPATKPNLLYYGMVSLALATVLLNRTGEYSLDKLRTKIPHRHGFDLVGFSTLDPAGSPIAVLEQICCKPSAGLFPIWYEALSPDPVVGKITKILPGNLSNVGLRLLSPGNKLAPFASISGKSLSAIQLLRQIPDMLLFLADTGVAPDVFWADISLETNEIAKSYHLTVAAHHVSSPELADRLIRQIRLVGDSPDKISIRQQGNSFLADIRTTFPPPEGFEISMPEAGRTLEGQTLLWDEPPLPEAVAHYGLMFCLSMLVRYYPDQWIRLLDRGHRGANFLLYFVDLAERKFPLLTLNELTQKFHCLE